MAETQNPQSPAGAIQDVIKSIIGGPTPGWKTTEFWAGVVGAPLLGLLLFWLSTRGISDPALVEHIRGAAEALLSYGPLGYILSRGLRKFGTGEPVKPVVPLFDVPPPTTATDAAKTLSKLP